MLSHDGIHVPTQFNFTIRFISREIWEAGVWCCSVFLESYFRSVKTGGDQCEWKVGKLTSTMSACTMGHVPTSYCVSWLAESIFPLSHYTIDDFTAYAILTTFFLLLLGFFAFLCFISLSPLFLLAKYRCKWWICDAYYLGKFLFVFILIVVYWKVCYPFTFVYWWAGLSLGTYYNARRACVGIIDELVRPMIAE